MTSVLRDTYSDTQLRALGDAQRAFGLDPTRFTERPHQGNDIAVLPGCRRFTDAERAQAKTEVEHWLATNEPKTGLLDIHVGCWLHGRGVIGATWVIDPDALEKPRSAIFRVGDRGLVLVERCDDDYVHTLELTSAGDLDGDGTLDFAYRRVAYGKQYIVINLDGIATVVTSSPDDLNSYVSFQPTFFAMHGRRGVTVAQTYGVLLENGYGPPVFANVLESWRLEHDKFVRDPDLDRRLTAATAPMRDRANAARWLRCAAECPMTNFTKNDEQQPCWLGHESEIRQSIALLGNGAGLRDAFAIIEESRATCFPPRVRPRAAR